MHADKRVLPLAGRGWLMRLFVLVIAMSGVSTTGCAPPQPVLPPLAPVLTGITLTPNEVDLASGEIYRPAIWAEFSDGATTDVTGAAAGTRYLVSTEELAQVDPAGMVSIAPHAITGDLVIVTASHGAFAAELTVTVRNTLAKTIGLAAVTGLPTILNFAGIDAVVTKQRNLPAGYVPPDLVTVNVPHSGDPKQMRATAARGLEELFTAAKAHGHTLFAASGYRSYATQQAIFARNVSQHGLAHASRYSAQAGQSEHQTGLAMDVTSARVGYRLVAEFGRTPEGLWVAENAARYGFIIRYPEDREHLTGYAHEPWHLRYLGRGLAEAVAASGLTLEEYLAD